MKIVVLMLLWASVGGLVGYLHFRLLAREARALVGQGSLAGVWLGRAARLVLTVGALWLAARWGALPLLAVLAGWLLARHRVLRAESAQPGADAQGADA